MPPVVPATSGIFIIPYIRMKSKKNPTGVGTSTASVGFSDFIMNVVIYSIFRKVNILLRLLDFVEFLQLQSNFSRVFSYGNNFHFL